MQVENYIQFRLQQAEKKVKNPDFENVTKFHLSGQTYYYNITSGEELEGEKLKEYLEYINNKESV